MPNSPPAGEARAISSGSIGSGVPVEAQDFAVERDDLDVDAGLSKIVEDVGLEVVRLNLARGQLRFAVLVLGADELPLDLGGAQAQHLVEIAVECGLQRQKRAAQKTSNVKPSSRPYQSARRRRIGMGQISRRL